MTDQSVAPVDASWRRIDEWLAAHAPGSLGHLNPPAESREIEAVESTLEMRLPAELAQSLGCHNGTRGWTTLLPEGGLLAAAGIARRWQMSMEIARGNGGFEPWPGQDEPWWHPLWLPWAESADGVIRIIDLRPGSASGRLGRAGHSGGADFTDAWPSLSVFLAAVAEALCDGRDVRGLHPYLTDDGDVWWDRADQREANGAPLRPAPVWLG